MGLLTWVFQVDLVGRMFFLGSKEKVLAAIFKADVLICTPPFMSMSCAFKCLEFQLDGPVALGEESTLKSANGS